MSTLTDEIARQHQQGIQAHYTDDGDRLTYPVCSCDEKNKVVDFAGHVAAATEVAVREQVAQEIESARLACRYHGIPDCSPLLNGCNGVRDLALQRERDAAIARGGAR